MSPSEVIEAITEALAQVDGLRVPTTVPGQAQPPTAIAEIAGVTAPSALGGSADYQVRVTLLVQRGDQRDSQARTLALIDPDGTESTSVLAALLSVPEVGQVEFDGPGLVTWADQQYSGGIFTLTVLG